MTEFLAAPSLDETLEILANIKRRRLLLALLADSPQNEIPSEILVSAAASDPMEVRTAMRHAHLPKLAEYGFIEWEQERHQVSRGPNFDELRPMLELLDERDEELLEVRL